MHYERPRARFPRHHSAHPCVGVNKTETFLRRTFRLPVGWAREGRGTVELEFAQSALWLAGWIVSFMLGRELQTGYAQWQETRRRK